MGVHASALISLLNVTIMCFSLTLLVKHCGKIHMALKSDVLSCKYFSGTEYIEDVLQSQPSLDPEHFLYPKVKSCLHSAFLLKGVLYF